MGMHHRAFVGGDGVHAAFQRGAQMVNCRLAGVVVDRRILEQRIRRALTNEIQYRGRRGQARKRVQGIAAGCTFESPGKVNPIRMDGCAVTAGGDPGDS